MLNDLAPYRMFNAITQKERWLVAKLWPTIKKRLEEKFDTQFALDKDYNIYYDNSKATKDEVLKVSGEVFMEYYRNLINNNERKQN